MADAIAPDGSQVYYRVLDADRASLVEIALLPGGVSRPVRHRTVEEIWYFLAGSGEVWTRSPDGADESVRAVNPGDVAVIRAGWHFQFRATSAEELRFLCYTTPPWPGDDEAVPVERGGLGAPAT